MSIIRNFFWLLLVASVFLSHSACNAKEQVSTFCIPDSEFIVAQISLSWSKDQILKLKGTPIRISFDSELLVETLEYQDLKLEISNDKVLYLSTSSLHDKTPSGISPGMTKKQVMEILGYKNHDLNKKEFQFVNCSSEAYLILKFNDQGILESISIGNDLP